MNNFLRAIIAGYGAKKLGGGCLSTILIFIVIYWALGNCNSSNNRTTAPARPASLLQERTVAANLNADKSHNIASYSNHLSTSSLSK
jgi:hypothetical protein